MIAAALIGFAKRSGGTQSAPSVCRYPKLFASLRGVQAATKSGPVSAFRIRCYMQPGCNARPRHVAVRQTGVSLSGSTEGPD
jgi:hypothetical protein